ncbi:hypothetical protein F5J12DRAFT_831256 [Pisolithus orientalis]|uniref:uncharacterized protein n=1 Tax=Pisolithus orientalis TaxID=936130 RepID=UPI0022244F1C|nr:uncharacterized protein F5J12DRAFT_831256 [Pisolithus orientalis]KAI6006521.1 hypothetical protein F5J12DRAFT_831256 [Pisolithus orientalis]
MPDSSPIIFPGASRSNSLASTVSSSGASLSRRSRIRKRTRTTTESSRPECIPTEFDNVLDISASHNQELVSTSLNGPSETPNDPPASHSETGNNISDIHNNVNPNTSKETCGTFGPVGQNWSLVRLGSQPEPPRKVEIIAAPTTFMKGKGRNSNLPRLTSPPSSFRPTHAEACGIRLLTQQSSTSSSVYPLSTSTGTESTPFSSDVSKVQEFDADDVSYRLRLLMKNSYFLPPAHSKPSPSDFPPAINPTKKAPAPAFLDLFRVGKAKSKPASPDAPAPVVRVTSDSTTASRYVLRDNARPSMQVFRPPLGASLKVDLNTHEFLADRERATRRCKPEIFDGIVDPTDVVDIPPPSANYPLALQASALHGLGIEESVGAAVLAERLPPPASPGASTLDPRDNAWRKALLHEAVNHSLNNSAASLSAVHSTPTKSPHHVRSSESLNHIGIQQQKKMLEQKILSHPIIDPSEDFDPPFSPTPAAPANPTGPPATLTAALIPDIHRLSNYAPLRAETPVPHIPLSPPPRRALPYSKSQTDLSTPMQVLLAQRPKKVLRRSMSSPMLSDTHEARTAGTMTPTKTPPPMPSLSVSPNPSSHHRISLITSLSRYTSEPEDVAVPHEPAFRPSLVLSVQSIDGRPTSSEYSQPSPTASAFRDRWSEGYYSANSQLQLAGSPHNLREPPTSPASRSSRLSAMSPPPRSSSSLAGIALTPAPRPGYLPFHSTSSRIVPPSRSSSDLSRGTFRSFVSVSASQHMQLPTPLDVNHSVLSFHSALHSAPPPSSTAEFFDHIQGYPSAMDGLYDSEDSASEADPELTAVYAPPPEPQRSFTRLGNHSTPDIMRGATVPYYPTGISKDRKKPVGNAPPEKHYFTNLKASPHSLSQLSLSQNSKEHLIESQSSSPLRRPATPGEENIRRWQREQLALEESSKKLDGMVIQHMQAERDTMRRIAETAKVPKS